MKEFNKKKDTCPKCGTILRNYVDVLGERIHLSELVPDLLELFTKKNLLNKG
ncbi:MAG: hypothetical protein KAX33_10155 [Candidatus Lokiarchaeota archaeon]|nr:hypothetical protein [Candidatus Lokiarchaeota archaeon]